ncbi:MAG: transposase [Chloroflexota bacterium]
MPRRTTEFAVGHYYHIYNRGAGKENIFRDQENYHYAVGLLEQYAHQLQVFVVAYCLMPNHYHLLLRQDGAQPAGLLPQLVFNRYTKAFNKRYARTGTLFEGRYQSVWVDKIEYLFHLCRYIHANPVKARLVSRPEDWAFSNYLEWIDARDGTLVDQDFVAESFPEPARYREFVADYVDGLGTLPEDFRPYLLD